MKPENDKLSFDNHQTMYERLTCLTLSLRIPIAKMNEMTTSNLLHPELEATSMKTDGKTEATKK